MHRMAIWLTCDLACHLHQRLLLHMQLPRQDRAAGTLSELHQLKESQVVPLVHVRPVGSLLDWFGMRDCDDMSAA